MNASSNSTRSWCALIVMVVGSGAVLAALVQDVAAQRKALRRAPEGPLLTVHTPQPEQFELAVDEVELEADRASDAIESAAAPRLVASTALITTAGGRSALRVSGASGPQDLLNISTALEAANPGSRVSWVLYRPEVPRTASTRVLLTREVGLLLEEDARAEEILADVGDRRAVPGVPNGLVVNASDPLAALNLVDKLRQRSGVRTAYSLLKHKLFPR